MIKILMAIIFTLVACSESKPLSFKVTNPNTDNEKYTNVWLRHNDLPVFDTKLHSDGCSGGMSLIYENLTFLHKKHGTTLQWRQCCEVHDKSYYYGGSKQEKKVADMALSTCVSQVVGEKYLGKAMQIAVEIGGGPNLPTSYRWSYGEDFK